MQFDLFTDRRGPAQIVPFPAARRKGLVSATARALAQRDEEAGRIYWRTHLKRLRADLKDTGHSPKQISAEVEWYTAAVSHEVIILTTYRQGWPNDAA